MLRKRAVMEIELGACEMSAGDGDLNSNVAYTVYKNTHTHTYTHMNKHTHTHTHTHTHYHPPPATPPPTHTPTHTHPLSCHRGSQSAPVSPVIGVPNGWLWHLR